jgi:hypothetical protein
MNKRGFFLAEETVKIILAVICLGFLIFVLGRMYYSYTADKELQQAKDSLAFIEKEANLMKTDDSREVVIYSPAPKNLADWWILIGFSGQVAPSSCSGNDCLCICPNRLVGSDMKTKCEKDGTCISFSGKILSVQQTDLKNLPITILIKQTKNAISFSKK